jgi:hypothetical protein
MINFMLPGEWQLSSMDAGWQMFDLQPFDVIAILE